MCFHTSFICNKYSFIIYYHFENYIIKFRDNSRVLQIYLSDRLITFIIIYTMRCGDHTFSKV